MLDYKRVIIVHYAEIALKGKDRPFFESRLLDNLRQATADFKGVSIKKLHDRLVLSLPEDGPLEELEERLSRVFGVANFGVGWQVFLPQQNKLLAKSQAQKFIKQTGELIVQKLMEQAGPANRLSSRIQPRKRLAFKSFRIETRRSDKKFPLSSLQVNYQLGEVLANQLKKQVDLRAPDLTVFVEIAQGSLFFYWEKFAGPGGLPVSSAGKVLALLSGGIDSPVAAWYLMRRGAKVDFVHFHSYPFTSKQSLENVKEAVRVLGKWQGPATLYAVPLADIQKRIVAAGSPKLILLLYRRAMLRLAQKIAEKARHQALVTGESLGQVASQTLANLQVIENAASLQVFRPLIGFDKSEIIQKAKEIGTYEISIRPYEDCCSLFVPDHPETRATEQQLQEAEKNVDFGQSLENALRQMEVIKLEPALVSR